MRILWFLVCVALAILALVLLAPSVVEHMPEVRNGGSSEDLVHGPALFEMSDVALDEFLQTLSQEIPSLEDRLRILTTRRIGTPYERDCLGEEGGVDPDPLFRVDTVDCTVFILTQAALAHAGSVTEARLNMKSANYRQIGPDRPISFESRLHFTLDRLESSPYFRNITQELAGLVPLKRTSVILNRKADGTRLIDIPWEKEVTASYVPAKYVDESLLDRLPAVAGAALVKEKLFDLGLVVAHEGMLLDGCDFVHASSSAGKIVRLPFLEYLLPEAESPLFDGVIFYEFR